MYGKLQAFRFRLKELSHFYIKWPNANSSRARISLLYGLNFEYLCIRKTGPIWVIAQSITTPVQA